MVVLIILNIILIFILLILVFYIVKSNSIYIKGIFKKDDTCKYDKNKIEKIENVEINNENNLNSDRVFVGRIISEEEYEQIMKNRRSDISILIEELNNEYEHLKELNK